MLVVGVGNSLIVAVETLEVQGLGEDAQGSKCS